MPRGVAWLAQNNHRSSAWHLVQGTLMLLPVGTTLPRNRQTSLLGLARCKMSYHLFPHRQAESAIARDFGLKPRAPQRTPSRGSGLRRAKAVFCQSRSPFPRREGGQGVRYILARETPTLGGKVSQDGRSRGRRVVRGCLSSQHLRRGLVVQQIVGVALDVTEALLHLAL
jgi:hypothetical protein